MSDTRDNGQHLIGEHVVSSEEFVCGACFGDQGLKDFCSNHAESTECDFCGATDSEPIAARLDEVVEHIDSCIHRHFDDPANAGLPYETAEGGWQGATYDTWEVFEQLGLDFPNDSDGRLHDAISEGLDNDLWSEADPYGLSPDQQLSFSWERFCRVIKHQRRFFFLHEDEGKRRYGDDELFSPAETLQTIFSFAEEANAFTTMPADTKLYRARYQPAGKIYDTAGTLGPPPLDRAIQTNRMSPPGVVMTYAAEDRETALAETANGPGTFAIGQFVNDRDLLILDLTRLPDAPSVFAELPDSIEFDPRPRLNFLHNISREISRPIARDDRVHIEYVPTQVVTEYVRTVVRINGRKVDGVRYASSRRHAATAVVLFADQSHLILEGDERPEFYRTDDRWLRLEKVEPVEVSQNDIRKWAAEPRHRLL
jgi:hypothetical protein